MASQRTVTEWSIDTIRRSSMGNSLIAAESSYRARVGLWRATIKSSARSGRNFCRQSSANAAWSSRSLSKCLVNDLGNFKGDWIHQPCKWTWNWAFTRLWNKKHVPWKAPGRLLKPFHQTLFFIVRNVSVVNPCSSLSCYGTWAVDNGPPILSPLIPASEDHREGTTRTRIRTIIASIITQWTIGQANAHYLLVARVCLEDCRE